MNGYIARHHPEDALIGYRDRETGETRYFSSITYRVPVSHNNEGEADALGHEVADKLFSERAVIVEKFIRDFSDLFELPDRYRDHEKKQLALFGGCYARDGVEEVSCFHNISLSAGYYGAAATPFGYYAELYLGSVGIFEPQVSVGIEHRLDLDGHFDLNASVSQHHKLFSKKHPFPAYVQYEYMTRKRPGAVDGDIQKYYRHGLLFSLALGNDPYRFLSNISIATGVSYVGGEEQLAGPLLGLQFYNLYGAFALFNKEVDFLLSWFLDVPLQMREKPFLFLRLGVDYERFRAENRFLFCVGVSRW